MQHTLSISEILISDDPLDVIVAESLGSCIGLTLYDASTGIGGMVLCPLPLSDADPETAKDSPGMFTDTGIKALLNGMLKRGCTSEHVVAKLAGASQGLGSVDFLRTGERNYTIARRELWSHDLLLSGRDVGGTESRTMTLYLNNGRTTIRSNGPELDLV